LSSALACISCLGFNFKPSPWFPTVQHRRLSACANNIMKSVCIILMDLEWPNILNDVGMSQKLSCYMFHPRHHVLPKALDTKS
jgi:hypothetical protein